MFRNFIIFPIIFLNFIAVSGQDSLSPRPKVGLVLSGEAAKGMAHIGALKVLEEAGLPVDYIGGTSMGAIIGGLYAAGYSADELEKLAMTRNWDKLLSDAVQRKELSIEEKPDNDRFILSIPFRERKLSIPTGVVYGQNIENLFNTLCAPVYQIRDFNNLPIPYLCVAVDLVTGEQVVFHDGYLPEAMRSSMAIPTMFSAVEYRDKLLVDGGLFNNFPAEEVKEMGADILIGVYVGREGYTKEEINDLFKVFDQTIFLASKYTNQVNQDLCDLIIRPDMKNYGSSSFHSADSLVILGEQAAHQLYPEIKKLADSLNNFPGHPKESSSIDRVDSILIREIHINGLEKVSRKLIEGKLQLKTPVKYSPGDISMAIERVYSSLYFDKVTWELEGIPSETASKSARLIVYVKEKKGIDLRLGFNYNSDFKASLVFNGVARNILLNGSRLSTTFSLGESPFLHISFFKNNGWKPGFGLDVYGEDYDAFFYEGSMQISTVRFSDLSYRLYTQSIVSNSYSLGGGLEYETIQLRPGTGDIIWERQRTELINLYGFINIDTYDDLFYPTTGQRLIGLYKFITNQSVQTHFFTFRFHNAIPVAKKITMIPSLLGGFTSADSTLAPYLIYLGGVNQKFRNGLLPFTGLDFMQKADRYAAVFSFDLQYNVWRNNYIILKTNVGTTSWDFTDLIEKDNGFYGFGITVGNNSPIGPIEFTLMGSSVNRETVAYFNIGYWF